MLREIVMKNLPILTIAIPTFDRPNEISKRFDEILPQIRDNNKVQLLVIDNNSPVSVEYIYTEKYGANNRENVKIITNTSNVGLSANVCKCFEHAAGLWVWILGDDDAVRDNAVELLMESIASASDRICCINFSSDFNLYQSEIILHTTSELERYLKDNKKRYDYPVSNLVYLSVNCYRADIFKNLIRYGYLSASTHCPHFGMVLIMLIKKQGSICLKTSQLVKWDANHSGKDWSKIRLISGASFLSELESLDNSCITIIKSLVNEFCPKNFVRWISKIVIGDTAVPIGYWYSFFGRLITFGKLNVKITSALFMLLLPAFQFSIIRKISCSILNPRHRSKFAKGENRL